MLVADRRSPDAGWARESLAGFTGALAALPPVLTIGLLAFSPLGALAPQVSVFAAFVTAGIGGLAHALLSRTRMPVAGPSSPTALTLATLVAQLVADPRLAPGGALGLPGVVALCAVSVLLSGVLQIPLALLGFAQRMNHAFVQDRYKASARPSRASILWPTRRDCGRCERASSSSNSKAHCPSAVATGWSARRMRWTPTAAS